MLLHPDIQGQKGTVRPLIRGIFKIRGVEDMEEGILQWAERGFQVPTFTPDVEPL